MDKQEFQTSRLERLSYGGFFLGQNIIYVIQLQFLVYYYTEQVGLTIASTTLMLLVARVWDAFNDPIMGAIIDKCNFKSGKYMLWLRIAAFCIPLSLLLVFVEIDASYSVKLVYAYATYFLWDIMYTISDAPIFSLSTAMTSNVFERDKLMSYGRLAAALAAISSAAFMSLKASLDWTGTVAVYCFIAFLMMLPLLFTARERVQYKRSDNISFGKIFKFLFKNKFLLIYYTGYLAINATNTLQTIAAYFANFNLGSEAFLTVIMSTTVVPVVLIAPFLPVLIKMMGKKKLTVYSSIITIALCIIQYIIGYENFMLFLVITSVRVLFMQIPPLIYGMFTADCIEYGAYLNGERTEAMAFSLQTLVTKLSGAICSTISLLLLGYFGYVGQVVQQSPRTLEGIWIILTLVPAIGYAIMLIVMAFYKLDEQMVDKYIASNLKQERGVGID